MESDCTQYIQELVKTASEPCAGELPWLPAIAEAEPEEHGERVRSGVLLCHEQVLHKRGVTGRVKFVKPKYKSALSFVYLLT